MIKAKKNSGKIFAVRCYVDGKRKLSHKLTRKEAKCLHSAAMHLASYLATSYKFKGEHVLKCTSHVVSFAEIAKESGM